MTDRIRHITVNRDMRDDVQGPVDEITDEQIRVLLAETEYARDLGDADLRWWCQIALGERPGTSVHRASESRRRCADAYNARHRGDS